MILSQKICFGRLSFNLTTKILTCRNSKFKIKNLKTAEIRKKFRKFPVKIMLFRRKSTKNVVSHTKISETTRVL